MIRKYFFNANSNPLNYLIKTIDQTRAQILKRTLKFDLLRTVYSTSHLRLGSIFIIASVFYLPIALNWPEFLLALGPLIYGYFHLISSYYFTQPIDSIMEHSNVSRKKFLIFCSLTLFMILFNFTLSQSSFSSDFPIDFFEVMASTLLFFYIIFKTRIKTVSLMILILVLNLSILTYAWHEPLIFLSATLFIHNWIAFVYWIVVAKNKQNLITAVSSMLFFGVIHYLVISGQMDSLINFNTDSSIFHTNIKGTSWLLASWAIDPIIGQRALVLYTFGLSLHYFIWLKAIPENRQKRETPNSYQEGYQKLKKNIGTRITLTIMGIAILGTSLWLFDLKLGANIYFSIATLHAWLEFNFIISRIFTKKNTKLID